MNINKYISYKYFRKIFFRSFWMDCNNYFTIKKRKKRIYQKYQFL